MTDGRDYQPPRDTGSIDRVMMKCTVCKVTQTVACAGELPACGACGGELAPFDWDAHRASLPYVPYDKTKDPNKKR